MRYRTLCIATTIIAIVAFILLMGVLYFHHLINVTVAEKINARISVLNWKAYIHKGTLYPSPNCIENIILKGTNQNYISLSDVCINSYPWHLFSDSPNADFSIRKISGILDKDALKHSKNPDDKEDNTKDSKSKLLAASLFAHIEDIDILVGSTENHVKIVSKDADAWLEKGRAEFEASIVPGVHLQKSPFALRNIPTLTIDVWMDLDAEHWFGLTLESNPPLEAAFAWNSKVIETSLEKLKITAEPSPVIHASGIKVQNNTSESNPKENSDNYEFKLGEIKVSFSDRKPSKKSLKEIAVISPELSLNIDALLSSPEFSNNPVFSGIIGFWQQDAGAFLGDAPKKSVKRADVKAPAPPIRKNPIPKETLAKLKDAFDGVQKKVQALPAIDIQNGKIQIIKDDAHFSFDAISFNTSELFREGQGQNFQLEFKVRQATASFLIAYDNESPYPDISFSIKNLATPDFLHLINMPVPDQNDGNVSLDFHAGLTDDEFSLEGRLGLESFAFFHPKVSPNVVKEVNASARMDLRYRFAEDSLTVNPLVLSSGPVTASGFFKIENVRSNPVIKFELGAKDIPCADIPKAIPKGLLPTITNLELVGGKMSPTISGTIPWKSPLTSHLAESGFSGVCFPVSVEPHHPEVLNNSDYTFTTPYTFFEEEITVGPGTDDYIPLRNIPPYVRAAMFLTEDKRFFDHGPLRIAFIERALRLNLNQRSYVYGGSTIAQQLTKNLFLNRNKNLARKLEEAFIAWRMEDVVPRNRIFELYLNIIEFGPDIYGIKKAARFYFDKSPWELTPLEGAFLASLKVMPSKGGRFYKYGFGNTTWWKKRMRYILHVLAENGYISGTEVLALFNWVPQFVYPPKDDHTDFRNIWLSKYNSPDREQKKK